MIGKEILNYRIVDVIGQGGMGTVYLGVNKYIQEQKVAIKVINHDMLNDFTRQRMEEEAHRLASLNHPNVVHLVNFHKDEKGNVYLIMEYAEGVCLYNFIHEINGLIVEERICPIFDQILDGIACAHNHTAHLVQGGLVKDPIIHCDIKPANIIITQDKEPKVKILDFGIAQILSGQGDRGRMVMGTPSYMSPEQVKGDKIDIRSDIYSLGVMLHQMLTGREPYDTSTLTDRQICQKVIEEPLPRMATYYKYVSDKLQKVVDKATAKNPDDRYQTCEDFKKAMHRAIYPNKLPLWTKITAAVAVALIIGAGIYIWDYNRYKTYYYKDYVEQWGIPQGIGELSKSEHSHAARSYKFTCRRGKLQRVSHVNSMDYLIDDRETERKERPVDQEFYYADNGKLSSVKVKDRCGKTLHIKRYNENMKVMDFMYDDEHNTKMLLSNSSVSYKGLMSTEVKKGRISTLWIDYDDNGYVKSETFHSIDCSPVTDKNGIFGRTYVRDEKGRPTEIHYIGKDSLPQATTWGLGIKKFEYDSEDNWVKAVYLTEKGQSAYDDPEGLAILKIQYDDYGNETYYLFEDSVGSPMFVKNQGCFGYHYTYNEKGLVDQIDILDSKVKPIVNRMTAFLFDQIDILDFKVKPMRDYKDGYAVIKREYDDHGYCARETYCDTLGVITSCKDGYARVDYTNDEHGTPLEVWYKDEKGELFKTQNGYAGIKNEYDSIGRLIKQVYYGIDRKPTLNKTDKVAGFSAEYDEKNQLIGMTFLGVDLKPAEDDLGIICYRLELDIRGNRTKTVFCDADGRTKRNLQQYGGIAGWEEDYDENGNPTEVRYFDEKGKYIMVNGYFAKKRYKYDENGNKKSERWLNLQDELSCTANGIARIDYDYDRKGNCMEERYYGENDSLAFCYDKEYFCAIKKYKYDSRGNLIKISRYDTEGNLGLGDDFRNLICWAIKRCKYDKMNNCIEESYYDVDDKPILDFDKKYHKKVYKYDAYGRLKKTINYDDRNIIIK